MKGAAVSGIAALSTYLHTEDLILHPSENEEESNEWEEIQQLVEESVTSWHQYREVLREQNSEKDSEVDKARPVSRIRV